MQLDPAPARINSMGPKLLAAFGAGVLVTAVALFLTRPQEPAALPTVVPGVATAPSPEPQVVAVFPEHVTTPAPAPAPKPAVHKTQAKKFRTVASTQPKQAPAASAISLPEADDIADAVDIDAPPIGIDNGSLPPRQPQTVTIAAGTLLQVRLAERLASDRNLTGDTFAATLDQPLVVDGYVIANKGARVLGHIVDVTPAGRVQGVAQMSLELSSLTTADGQRINVRTARFFRKGDTSHQNDAVKIGAGAAIGAAIGAIAGGGQGAAIGAASGGAAGTAAVLVTRGKAASLDTETRLSFKLENPVTVTERP